jgi:hypothetical protein
MSWFKLAMANDKCGCGGGRSLHNSINKMLIHTWMCVTGKYIYVFIYRTAQICKNQHLVGNKHAAAPQSMGGIISSSLK